MMDPSSRLTSEQVRHVIDLLRAQQDANRRGALHRLDLLAKRLEALEASQQDQESRLRQATDSLVRLNTLGSLTAVGQSMLSLILAAIAAWIGSR